MALTQETYNSALSKAWWLDKLRNATILKYWDNSPQLKALDSFGNSQVITNKKKNIPTKVWNKTISNPIAVSEKLPVKKETKLTIWNTSVDNPHTEEINKTIWSITDITQTTAANNASIINDTANQLSSLIAKKNAWTITAWEKRQLDRLSATNAYVSWINKNLEAVWENVQWQKDIAERSSAKAKARMFWNVWAENVSNVAAQQLEDEIQSKYAWWISAAEQYWIDKRSALQDKVYWAENALIDNQEELDTLIGKLTDEEYAPLQKALQDVAAWKTWANDKVNEIILELKKKQLDEQSTAVSASDRRTRQETEYNKATTSQKRAILWDYLWDAWIWYLDEYIKKHSDYTSMNFADVESWVAELMKADTKLQDKISQYLTWSNTTGKTSKIFEDLIWSYFWWAKANVNNSWWSEWQSSSSSVPESKQEVPKTDTNTWVKKEWIVMNNNWTYSFYKNWVNVHTGPMWDNYIATVWKTISQLQSQPSQTTQEANELRKFFEKNKNKAWKIKWGNNTLVFDWKWNWSYNWSTPAVIWEQPKLKKIEDFKARWSKLKDLKELLDNKSNEYSDVQIAWNWLVWYKWDNRYIWTINWSWDVVARSILWKKSDNNKPIDMNLFVKSINEIAAKTAKEKTKLQESKKNVDQNFNPIIWAWQLNQ